MTQWLMIIIPMKNCYYWGYTPFSDIPICYNVLCVFQPLKAKLNSSTLGTCYGSQRLVTVRRDGKAIVVKTYDDGSKARPFGHCMVAGIDRAPLKVTRWAGLGAWRG